MGWELNLMQRKAFWGVFDGLSVYSILMMMAVLGRNKLSIGTIFSFSANFPHRKSWGLSSCGNLDFYHEQWRNWWSYAKLF